ncbi:hypothetical protein [Massilia horti]|uniref:Uncharacterized protein n=1 Tax=Massilia horti TaxID=2562153 RepID=A0A4Y9T8S7_9BURK|nr:hypothetical protein [Massilia horti]TFW35286.1 hypothetical protein E4O92_02300 [Massilia horti]
MPIVSGINRKSSHLYRLGFEAPFRESRGRAFIRALNWYTGVGKTYNAACFALQLFLNEQVVPVFLAPLHSIVTGFASEVRRHLCPDRFSDAIEDAVRDHGGIVPIYRLYSREYHFNDRTFFQAVLLLEEWLRDQPQVYAALEKDLTQKRRRAGASAASLAMQLAECRSKCNVCLKSELHSLTPTSDDYEAEKTRYDKAADKVLSMANRITRKVIDLEVRSRYHGLRHRFMATPVVSDMVRRLYPLQAFAEKPGLIIGTAAKAATSLTALLYNEADERCKWVSYDSVFEFAYKLNMTGNPMARAIAPQKQRMRVVTFIDEEEDSYWYLFDQHKSVVNPQGRNDLNEVNADFHKFFDLTWPFAFEHGGNRALARKVFDNLSAFSHVSVEFERLLNYERVSKNTAFIVLERQIDILRQILSADFPDVSQQFINEELTEVYQKLIAKNDAHAGFQRFRQKAHVLNKVRDFVRGLPRNAREDDYTVFRRLRNLLFDKKFFLMSRSSYGEMLDQPSQTFFNASSSVMTNDYLGRLELLADTGDQTIRLEFRDRGLKKNAFTLLHYVRFVLLIAEVLDDNNPDYKVEFEKDDEKRYPDLYRFARDVRGLFKLHNHQDDLDDQALATDAVGDDFFFSGVKRIICMEESHRQALEYNTAHDIALSLSIVSLRDTPEEDLRNLLGECNGIYLLSATGGLQPCSSGAFNQRRLKTILKDIGGAYFPMTPEELAIVAAKAEEQRIRRRREVHIVDDSLLNYQFPASHSFAGMFSKFVQALPFEGKHRYDRMSRYKEQEVRGLVASLDRLLSTELRSAMCLCLSMQWARNCLIGLAQSTPFVRQLDHAGHHFVVDPMMLPQYGSANASEKIHIVLYAAGQFKKRDPSQTGWAQSIDEVGQFSDDLLQALDVTDKKILLWTAYRSAARGVNFITTRHDKQFDFELIYLVNSPFYNRHTRPGTRGFHIESFQSLIQVLNDRPQGANTMNRAQFIYEYSRHRWSILEREHYIDLCRTIFQALGRVERCPDNFIERQEIYVDVEVAKIVHLGTCYANELVQRASATQIAVLKKITEYNRHTGLFLNDEERRQHAFNSLRLAEEFRRYTKELAASFRTSAEARRTWEAMFDERMVTDQKAYIAHLGKNGFPQGFCDALYFRTPSWTSLYSRNMEVHGKHQRIITDSGDGTATYDWVASLAPAGLLRELNAPFSNLHRFAKGFPDKSTNSRFVLVPQPWFVTDIIKGYLAEREFIHFTKREFGLDLEANEGAGSFKLVNVINHPHAAEIYQKFDFYIEVAGKVLLAIDVKNWTRLTDHLNKKELERDAKAKQRRLAELFPDHVVHALYINLYGAHKHALRRHPVSGAISFMSMYVQGSSSRRTPWIPNANLSAAMLWSGE